MSGDPDVGANAQGTYSSQAKDNDFASVHLSTQDPVEKVLKFYEDGLKSRPESDEQRHTAGRKAAGRMIGAQDEAIRGAWW